MEYCMIGYRELETLSDLRRESLQNVVMDGGCSNLNIPNILLLSLENFSPTNQKTLMSKK